MIFGSRKSKKRRRTGPQSQEPELFGPALSFAAKEAYKLLRTNLTFALTDADGANGHVVGVTSSVRGEGKSTTTVNLASVIAEQGKKVIIVEGDLRLPTIQKKLKTRGKYGLSNALISRMDPMTFVHEFKVGEVDGKPVSFDVLAAGEIPPNPSELLGSKRMEEALEELKKIYDVVLLDLPPVTAVSDALVATKLVDGVVLIVRNGYSDTHSLNETIRQLQQVDGKILGFVYTCADNGMGGYRKGYKYKYYKYKYRRYNYSDYKDYK